MAQPGRCGVAAVHRRQRSPGAATVRLGSPPPQFTVPEASAWWVSVPLAAQALAKGAMAGVFADTAGDWGDVLLARRQIAPEKAKALNLAHRAALAELRRRLRDPSLPYSRGAEATLVGNALGWCDEAAGGTACASDGVQLLESHIVDGVCAEHVGGFEWSLNQTTGQVDPAVVRGWLDQFDAAARTNGSVLVKTWPGPETGPIDAQGPSWPALFRDPTTGLPLNRTAAGIGAVAGHMLRYSLAVSSPSFVSPMHPTDLSPARGGKVSAADVEADLQMLRWALHLVIERGDFSWSLENILVPRTRIEIGIGLELGLGPGLGLGG